MSRTIGFNLNGRDVTLDSDGKRTLLWVLRTEFALTGTKYGCGEGYCGACTVIVEGKAVRSCLTLLENVADKAVLTIEGLARNGELHTLQQAFNAIFDATGVRLFRLPMTPDRIWAAIDERKAARLPDV
jgi:aerobic-type carbon monoxide dehydrogenase small subunit (CoxS/CutS family)